MRGLVKCTFVAVLVFAGPPAEGALAAGPSTLPLATIDTNLVTPVPYICSVEPGVPGSGMGPQRRCRWVGPRRCRLIRGEPGSGQGPRRVCD